MLGKLVVFEGIDGSGKSTQFDMLCTRLADEGRDFRRVRFPRYDEPSSSLVRMYLGGKFGDDPEAVNPYAASSFFTVDRIASFLQDWKSYYEKGGLILTDRYTTSNAIHQGAKMSADKREHYYKWLYEFEFDLAGLPKPDCVIYMDIEAAQAARRLSKRQAETGTSGDIHEQDPDFLEQSAQSGKQAANFYGWHKISCFSEGRERSESEIHDEVLTVLSLALQL